MKKILPYSFKSPNKQWDYIIIGSGMGGMTAAGILSHLGKKVLILEQHYIPGGFTHSFKRENWEWDVGVHAVGEVTSHSLVGRVLKSITEDRLKWESLGSIYENFYFPNDFRIDFPDHPEKFKATLKDKFKDDHEAIDNYFKTIKKTATSMRKYFLSRTLSPRWGGRFDTLFKTHEIFNETTQSVLDRLTNNDRLKTVLSSQWGYYGATPQNSSFAIQALVMRHFAYGAYYPVGGSQQISLEMLKTVADNGGWTRVRSPVRNINIKNSKACGVTLKSGEVIESKNVISSAGALETITHLLPKDIKQATQWSNKLKVLKPSPCHLCLHLGFEGDISKLGASAANQWFWDTWEPEKQVWNFENNESPPPILYTSYPSLKDPTHKSKFHTAELVTFVPYDAFEKFKDSRTQRRGESYEAIKADLSERMQKQLYKFMPGLKSLLKYSELSTPLSTEHYTKSYKGAIYGLSPEPKRFTNPWLRAKSPIKNLYMAGSDVGSAGVIGAMVGGVLSTIAAQPVKSMNFLIKSNRQI